MKLIEYKPMGRFLIMDVQNIPEDIEKDLMQAFKWQPLTFISPRHKPSVHEINPNNKWVHPDYEVKEKTFSELIEIIKESGIGPDSMKGNSFENFYWVGHDPYDDLNSKIEIWEAAKPKFNPELNYKTPIIFGTTGENRKKLAPVVFENIWDKEKADFYNRHNKTYSDETSDLYWFSGNSKQLSDWLKRKKKTPLLNAHDFIWIDNMVDEVFKKHTSN